MPSRSAAPKARRRIKAGRAEQLSLTFPNTWGGRRPGAGSKRVGRPNTPHRARPHHDSAQPVHVTLRSRLGPLRSQHLFPVVQLAIRRACHREPRRFRVVHFSVQRDHVHLVVEAQNARALSSGMRSVAIRVARYVNDLLSRRGSLWADRWHGRALTSPREVRNVLLYVLANFRKHGRGELSAGLDAYSSAAWFDGWREWAPSSGLPPPLAGPRRPSWLRQVTGTGADTDGARNEVEACPVLASRTWLGGQGWRRYGLLGLKEARRAD